jgi:hypothetical protein
MARINTKQYAAGGTVFVGGGVLALISGFNNSANLRYLQVFNKASAASAGNAPEQSIIVPALSNFSWVPSAQANPFTEGCVWGVSSTPDTFTAAADLFWVRAEAQTQ